MSGAIPIEVDRAAQGVPVLQVAADGCWERARTAALPLAPDAVDQLLDALGAAATAVEVLWAGPPVVFVGAREGRAHREQLHRIAAREDCAPSQALAILAGGRVGPPVRAELGAVNAWQSVSRVPVAMDADEAAIRTALEDCVALMRGDHPIALEVVHDDASELWWAIEVAPRSPGAIKDRARRTATSVRHVLEAIDPEARLHSPPNERQ